MPFRRQTLEDEPSAEQNRELAILVTHMTSEEPRQIEKRHRAPRSTGCHHVVNPYERVPESGRLLA